MTDIVAVVVNIIIAMMCGMFECTALFFSITAPVSRLELSSLNGTQLRQCADLRRVLFIRTRRVMLAIKSATKELLNQYPCSAVASLADHFIVSGVSDITNMQR